MTTYRKKLIEVALPLEAINEASAREKSIRHGHPSTLHLWWARRPLAAARAVIFASLVDDPDDPEANQNFVAACKKLPRGKNTALNDTPRQRLFDFIERLVTWEATTDEAILEKARELIRLATDGNPPPLLDPFAGGGSIPLEAQRLGLEAHASDLNPVAVMINKAMIEIPPKFVDMPPVNPRDREGTAGGGSWKGAAGLAADVRYYGKWMREKAWESIGYLYPKCNGETVIAWIWTRTVKCPNPACGAAMPLVRSFDLSKRKGKQIWVEPHIASKTRNITFEVKQASSGGGQEGTVNRNGAICIACGTPVPFEYIRAEGRTGRIGAKLMAIVSDGQQGRNYNSPQLEHEQTANVSMPSNIPETDLPEQALGFRVQLYGMTKHRDLFTHRQLVSLATFSQLITEVRKKIYYDALETGMQKGDVPLHANGVGAFAYAEAVSVYLAFNVDRSSSMWGALCWWQPSGEFVNQVFTRHALSMIWDFAEVNPFSNASGNWDGATDWITRVLEQLSPFVPGTAFQQDVTNLGYGQNFLVSTDPPYYDNIGYADLSDYFYIWLRASIRKVFPTIFETLLVPKEPELIATPFRFQGDAKAAKHHFETGLREAFNNIQRVISQDYPLTIYYAFKQQEMVADVGTASTGWETMLTSLIETGLKIVGTWPMRTERSGRIREVGSNALASSIILVCRSRPDNAPMTSRREFINTLRSEMPNSLREMQTGNIAPVDLAQASIGPGMAVYSRYSKVLEPDGSPLTVRTALQIINHELDAYLAEQEGEMDGDSRFAVSWFEQFGFKEGGFGQADVLARAKNTSVEGLAQAGVLAAEAGKVRLLHWSELDPGWDPEKDKRLTVWETVHQLIERLSTHGEEGAARLLAKLSPEQAADARQMAYRLYSICERKNWAEQARDYNALVVSWGASQEQARAFKDQYKQDSLL